MEGQEWGVGGMRQQVREGTINVKMRYSSEFELQTDTYAGREAIGGFKISCLEKLISLFSLLLLSC